MQERNTGVKTEELHESNHVAAKFPQFFDVPEILSTQKEAMFRISNISRESTMFSHLLATFRLTS